MEVEYEEVMIKSIAWVGPARDACWPTWSSRSHISGDARLLTRKPAAQRGAKAVPQPISGRGHNAGLAVASWIDPRSLNIAKNAP